MASPRSPEHSRILPVFRSDLINLAPACSVLTGTSSYTGTTRISGGLLKATTPGASNLTIASTGTAAASYIPVTAAFERTLGTGAGQMQITGGSSGFTSQTAGQQVAFGTIASPTALTWGDASFNPTALVLNDVGATGTLDFKNAINLGTVARTVTVNSTAVGTEATLSGVLSSGAAGGSSKPATAP